MQHLPTDHVRHNEPEAAMYGTPRPSVSAVKADRLETDTFRLMGRVSGGRYEQAFGDVRPAVLAHYRDLEHLRYDYPLILLENDRDGGFVTSLSETVDRVLTAVAPKGIGGERLRKMGLNIEAEIRSSTARGTSGRLKQLWKEVSERLLAGAGKTGDDALVEITASLGDALRTDGLLLDCDAETPLHFFRHAWEAIQRNRERRIRTDIENRILKLNDILKADYMRSEQGRSPGVLKLSLGDIHGDVFDFERLSTILGKARPGDALPEARRRRIESALAVLESQRFVGLTGTGTHGGSYGYFFESGAEALRAIRDRLDEMVSLLKAIAIADLEIANRYDASLHDAVLDRFDARFVSPDDFSLFPTYFVHLRDHPIVAEEQASLIEILSSDMPVKVLLQSDDILGELAASATPSVAGTPGSRLARMAIGLDAAYVMQLAASHLYQLREAALNGMAYAGPTLFSVFSGATGHAGGLPPYLVAAAAVESRAFPTFVRDPGTGTDGASRVRIDANPQAESDWVVHRLDYEDENLNRTPDEVAFTFVDFALCDDRLSGHLDSVPRTCWSDDMLPVTEALESGDCDPFNAIPFVPVVDENDVLHRTIVDNALIHAARRCRAAWRGLRALSDEPGRDAAAAIEEPVTSAPPESDQRAPQPEAGGTSDSPYIETPRCTSCNECTKINSRMFAYDENKQAYIADPDAGTFRQLVEAAEHCQVAIIHPGLPRNPNEADLDALLERAQSFT